MPFVQIIEFTTSRLGDIEALMDEWTEKTAGKRKAQRGLLTADRDQPNRYVQIVEFPSYDEAMENSKLPETAEISQKLGNLCDGPVAFRNLDVRRVEAF